MPVPAQILAAIRQPAFAYLADGTVKAANDRAEALAGGPLTGMTPADVIACFLVRHRDGPGIVPSDLPASRALAGEEVVDAPLTITAVGGRTMHVLATASPIRNSERVVGALSIWQDVTGEVEAARALAANNDTLQAREEEIAAQNEELQVMGEELQVQNEELRCHADELREQSDALRVSLERLAFGQRAARTGFWDWDVATSTLTWSPEFYDILGLAPGMPASFESWLAVLHPDDRQRAMATISRSMEERVPLENEYRVVLPGGRVRWIGAYGDTTYSALGEPLRMAGICVDVTPRKEAEAALAESEARHGFLVRLNDALGPLADPVAVQGAAARVLGERLRADRVAYFEVDEGDYVVEHDYAPSVPHIAGRYPVDSFGPRLLAVYRSGRTAVGDDVEADPDLSPDEKAGFAAIQVGAYIGVPLVKAGAFVAGLAVHMATPRTWTPTEVALVEETAARTWGAVERARAEEALREYAESLRRSNEDLERFAYVASHDLQEPLRSIVSFSQLLERRYRGQLGEDADEYIAFIVEGGTRMQSLILDLLAFSRVNTTRQQITRTDAEAVFAEAVRTLDVSLREAGATLTHDPLPVVMADPTQLLQVFSNLVSNAVKFRREDEPLRIHVGARRLDGFWEFSVSDNGIGIEKEYYEKIFVIFQRLHTKDAYPGTGIGLAIVKRIIDRHGGRVWAESTPGEGSTFFFTLPAT